MERIVEHRLGCYLREVGYSAVEKRALGLYAEAVERYVVERLRSMHCLSRHALKSRVTLLDIFFGTGQIATGGRKRSGLLFHGCRVAESGVGRDGGLAVNKREGINEEMDGQLGDEVLLGPGAVHVNESLNEWVRRLIACGGWSRATASVYEQERIVEEERFVSPLGSSVEKYLHVYEFMPEFPPIHTFRQSVVKTSGRDSRSLNVKSRLEQSLKCEENLLKLVKESGSLPPFVNFLYPGDN